MFPLYLSLIDTRLCHRSQNKYNFWRKQLLTFPRGGQNKQNRLLLPKLHEKRDKRYDQNRKLNSNISDRSQSLPFTHFLFFDSPPPAPPLKISPFLNWLHYILKYWRAHGIRSPAVQTLPTFCSVGCALFDFSAAVLETEEQEKCKCSQQVNE